MRILYVVHSFPPYEYSGTPLIARRYADLARAAGHDVGVAFVAPREPPPPVDGGIRLFPIPAARETPWAFEAFSVRPRPTAATEALTAFRPDLVHIIDWVDLPSSVLGAVRELGVPVIRHVCNPEDICCLKLPIWFHADNRPCRTLTAEQCGDCLAAKVPERETARVTRELAARGEDASPDAVRRRSIAYFADLADAKWRAMRGHLDIYDELIFPSQAFRAYFESMVDLGAIPRRVIGHGIDRPAAPAGRAPRAADEPLRFTFLRWVPMKGRAVVEQCFQRLFAEGERRIRLSIHGVTEDAAKGPLIGRPEVTVCGAYRPEELDSVLSATDVGLVPSLFESFCLTCREMLARGIPVIASDAFGISDAVRHGENGLSIGQASADGLYDAIRSLLDSPQLLELLTHGARAAAMPTPNEEFAEILDLYRSHVARASAS